MTDQAQTLRNLVMMRERERAALASGEQPRQGARLITVTSGKGGVGKSNFTLNFALALQSMGKRVLVFDADIGMANIDVLMGMSAKYNLYHLLRREKRIDEIIERGPGSLSLIAGGSGLSDLFSLSQSDLNYFMQQIETVADGMDYVIFDKRRFIPGKLQFYPIGGRMHRRNDAGADIDHGRLRADQGSQLQGARHDVQADRQPCKR